MPLLDNLLISFCRPFEATGPEVDICGDILPLFLLSRLCKIRQDGMMRESHTHW